MKKIKILIVEDEFLCLQVLQAYLNSEEFIVSSAGDGLEAIQMFRNALAGHTPYKIIFMDIMLPKLDGLKTLLQIRDFEKDHGVTEEHKAKVIITSAVNDRKTILQTVTLGRISSFLAKPIDRNKLSKVMAQIVAEIQHPLVS